MSLSAITGKPGIQAGFTATPYEVFYSSRADARFIPGPVTVDGTRSADATNSPCTWLLRAGTIMSRDTTTGKYQNFIIGKTTAAYTSSGTTLTVGTATAAEIVRRIGSSGSLKLIGPPTAAGTVAVSSVTFSDVDTSTGEITVSDIGVNKVTDSLVVGAETAGAYAPVTVLCDPWGKKVIDAVNTTRIDVYDAQLWAGGGIIDEAKIQNWPADTSTQAWIKLQIRANGIPDAKFKGDLINT